MKETSKFVACIRKKIYLDFDFKSKINIKLDKSLKSLKFQKSNAI